MANALVAEFIGVKIFSLEQSLGFSAIDLSFFGHGSLSFNLTAGVLLWPVVFVMTDIINEYYGRRGVKLLSYLAVILILYAFIVLFIGIRLVPADFWPTSHLTGLADPAQLEEVASKVGDYNFAFQLVFGQGLWIIVGSLVAFLVGQFIDVFVFQKIKKFTGEKWVWLRATGSTLISQFVDSFVVLIIAFYVGAGWSLSLVLAIGLVNYIYKFVLAVLLTPAIYAAHYIIDTFLGAERSQQLRKEALGNI